jgi:hypothetical protein
VAGIEPPVEPALVAAPPVSVVPPPPPPEPPAPVFYPPAMTPSQPRDTAAVTSVISGALGLLGAASGFCCCLGPPLSVILGIIAVVFGHMSYNKAKGHPDGERDKGLATIGLVLGYLTIALSLAAALFTVMTVGLSAAMDQLGRSP